MTDHYFAALEKKIDLLLLRLNQAEEQNRQLKNRNFRLEEERAQLLKTQDSTRGRVESMLERLKALEKNS